MIRASSLPFAPFRIATKPLSTATMPQRQPFPEIAAMGVIAAGRHA